MKLLYIDAINSGISGDMFLASLLELVSNPEAIITELKELQEELSGVSKLNIKLVKLERFGIQVNQLKVDIKESKNHRTAKTLKNALEISLEKQNLSDKGKIYAKNVLNSLIQAEKEIHGELSDRIHLHELSSVDTLIDIIGVSKVLDVLGCFNDEFKILCSRLPLGGGTVETAHGVIPVPAPATLKILENSGLIVCKGPIESELVTPTGAALLVNLNPEVLSYEMSLEKVVYSTGQKSFNNFLNVLRVFYGEIKHLDDLTTHNPLKKYIESITIVETNVDDVSGEILGNFIKNFEKEDILDIQIVPSITKKNRPSHNVKILCRPENTFEIIKKILEELGTLGVRFNTINRVCVDRKIKTHKIKINKIDYEIRYKVSFIEHEKKREIVNIKPEYEDLRNISEDSGLTLKKVLFYARAQIPIIYENFKTD